MKRTTFFLVIMLALITSTFSQNPDCIYCGNNELGETSSAIGNLNQNYGEFSLTIGNSNIIARRLQMVTLIGSNNVANGDLIGNHSVAFGINNLIESDNSFIIGNEDTVSATRAITIGNGSKVSGLYSVGIGKDIKVSGFGSVGIGINSRVSGNFSVAIGNNAYANAMNSYSFGNNVCSDAIGSITIGTSGVSLKNTTPCSLIIGFNSNLPTLVVSSSMQSGYTGKVGIGNVTDPQAKLHIKADISEDATLRLEPVTGSNNVSRIYFSNTNDYYIQAANSQDMVFSTISGKNYEFKNGTIRGVNGTAQTPTYAFSSNNNNTGMYLPSTSTIAFSTNAVERVRITSTGNVGIGTTNPSSDRLEVNGFAKTSSGYKVGTYTVINSYSDYSGRNGTFSGNLAVTGTGNSSFVGNVGIGTTTPAERLEVAGWAKTSNGYKVGTSPVIDIIRNFSGNNGTFSGALTVTGTSTLSGNLTVAGNSALNGNVGIGVTTPQKKLDVNGDINFSGNIYQNNQLVNLSGFWASNVNNIFYNNGNVGIGTNNPIGQFQTGTNNFSVCLGKLDYSSISDLGYAIGYVGFNGKYSNNSFVFNSDGSNGGSLIYSTIGGSIHFVTVPNSEPGTLAQELTNSEIASLRRMTITGNGNIGIGISNPSTDYKLSVAGKILAEELQIQLVQDWYDNVFKAEYNLMDLNELESYVKQNNHLPDVPSEAEVMENGIRVGEMNALLLKKVEELTLYVIEQQKMLECQHTEIENLKQLFTSKNNH